MRQFRAPRKFTTTKYKKRRKREVENRRTKRETMFKRRIQPKPSPELICPLCNQSITGADLMGNLHTVRVGKKDVSMHWHCPGEGA